MLGFLQTLHILGLLGCASSVLGVPPIWRYIPPSFSSY